MVVMRYQICYVVIMPLSFSLWVSGGLVLFL